LDKPDNNYNNDEIQNIAYQKGEDPLHYTPYFDSNYFREEKILLIKNSKSGI
jgi:hypothetical protein